MKEVTKNQITVKHSLQSIYCFVHIFRFSLIRIVSGAVKPSEYYDFGLVTDFKYSFELSQVFSGKKNLKELKNLGKIFDVFYNVTNQSTCFVRRQIVVGLCKKLQCDMCLSI